MEGNVPEEATPQWRIADQVVTRSVPNADLTFTIDRWTNGQTEFYMTGQVGWNPFSDPRSLDSGAAKAQSAAQKWGGPAVAISS